MPDKWSKIAQNTKGGPLDDKIFFSKNFSDLDYNRLIFSDFAHWFQKHIYQCSLHHARPIFTPCTLRAPCTEAKRGVLGSKSSDIYVFGISEENLKKWAYYGPNLWIFLKQIFFSKKFSDLDHSGLIFSDFPHWFQKHIYQWILNQALPFFPLCTVHVACTEWKWGVHDAKNTDIYVFGISEKNLKK